ncbi:hypothetical protein ACFUIY_33520 [Streptomyces griseorubiginosus]|uniref:hypothetical protein n=1 Tax=Streptomyces griseorubiginosus TaxID=67304 RepID=UPI0036456C3B
MNVSLLPLPPAETRADFDQVLARFPVGESGVDFPIAFCDLGEEAAVVEELLLRAGAGELASLAAFGGAVLGDDGVGTACTLLSVDEVTRVHAFLTTTGTGLTAHLADVLSATVRGDVPYGYADDLIELVGELRGLFESAARDGFCVVHLHEG